jgi:hypothetical protein
MKNILGIIAICMIAFSCNAGNEKKVDNQLTQQEKKDGWELLFDGKTTKGWRNYGKETISGWKVIDGVLYNSGVGSDHGGDVVSDKQYESFELYLEWKIAKASNSGVFYHVDESLKAIYMSGPEYQLLDDKGWPTKLKASQYTGANYGMDAPQNSQVKPLDQFNSTRIVVNGPKVQHWLNGTKVVEYELWTDDWKAKKEASKWKEHPNYGMFKKGHIGLQDHGGLTMFKNIKIRKL